MNGRFSWSVIVLLGCLSMVLGGANHTRAGLVTVNFTATIETVPDPNGVFAGANLKKGEAIGGTLIYNTQAQAIDTGSNTAQYNFTSTSSPAYATPLGFSLDIGGHNLVSYYPGTMMIKIQDDLAGQTYPSLFSATATVQDTTANQNALLATVALGDSSGTVFNSAALPSSLDLSKFDAGQFVLQSTQTSTPIVVLTALVEVGSSVPNFSIPEPSSVVLMSLSILGLCMVAGLRRLATHR